MTVACGCFMLVAAPYRLVGWPLFVTIRALKSSKICAAPAGEAVILQDYLAKDPPLLGICIQVGTFDEYTWIPKGCTCFSSRLTANKIPHELIVIRGRHVLHGPVAPRCGNERAGDYHFERSMPRWPGRIIARSITTCRSDKVGALRAHHDISIFTDPLDQ